MQGWRVELARKGKQRGLVLQKRRGGCGAERLLQYGAAHSEGVNSVFEAGPLHGKCVVLLAAQAYMTLKR